MRRSNDETGAFTATMNARNQLLVVLTALMLVCSSGAMVTAATSGNTIDQSSESSTNEYDSANETTNETIDDEQDEATTGIDGNETVPGDDDADNETADADNDSQPAYVTFEDQTTEGETVVVENVTLASPGFVTIHDSSLLVGDVFESVIGTSEYLEAGTHEQVEVTLDEPLEEDETLIAMPHRDTNDNQTYDFVESEGQFDGPFLTADDEPVTDDAVVTVEGAADEEPVEENETDEDVQQPDDNVTDEEPTDNVTDEPIDDNETDEPIGDNVTDEDEVVDEEPADEMPMEDLPVDGDGQPIFVTVENLTIENLNVENVTVYVLVVGEDVDGDEIADQINNVTDGEMPVVDETEDNVTDDNETEENITPIDEEPIDDNETEDDVIDDNETEDDLTPIDDNETEDNETEDNLTPIDEEPIDEEPIDDNETEDDVIDDNETEDNLTPIDDNETEDNESEDNLTPIDEEPIDDNETEDDADDVAAAESFNVSDLEAPSSAAIGENITVTANVSNPTDEERTEAIQFRLDGDLVAEQNVTLESGASEDVEFEVDTTGLAAGEYVHMVLSDESGEVAALELTEETDTGLDNETNETETGLNETEDGLNDTGENTTDGVTAG